MDQQTERMLRNDIRLRNAPIFILFWVAVLCVAGVACIAVVAYLSGPPRPSGQPMEMSILSRVVTALPSTCKVGETVTMNGDKFICTPAKSTPSGNKAGIK